MAVNFLNPLAQSFVIDKPCFVTKVDLFFINKDDDLPMKVSLCNMKDGLPKIEETLPKSSVVVPSANVAANANANAITTVAFNAPVFLDIGEYALTLGSDSNNYRVAISELDGTDSITGQRVTEQPLTGSLFKAQNASTWTATQTQDLKYRLYRAKFNTGVTSTVNLIPTLQTDTKLHKAFDRDALEFYPNSKIIKVYADNHGLVNGSYAKINFLSLGANLFSNTSGQSNVTVESNGMVTTYVTAPNVYGHANTTFDALDKSFLVSNSKLDSFTIVADNPSLVTKRTRGFDILLQRDVVYSSLTPQIATLNPGNTSINHFIKQTPISNFSVAGKDSTFNSLENLKENAFENEKVLTNSVNASKKMSNVDTITYKIEMNTDDDRLSPVIDLSQSGIISKRNLINEPVYSGVEDNDTIKAHEIETIVNNNQANVFPITESNTIGVISLEDASDKSNATALINGSIITLSNTTALPDMETNSGQYRVVSVTDSGANVTVSKLSGNIVSTMVGNAFGTYVITNSFAFVSEEAAVGGTTFSKYITKQIDLKNASTAIKFILDASVPTAADLEFYFKAKLAGDNTNFNDIEYTKINDVTITSSIAGEFNEIEKLVEDIPQFNSLVFKIVMKSTDGAQSPKLKNLRIIVLE